MRIELEKSTKIKLLQAIKQGYIDTLELPELFYDKKQRSMFLDILMESEANESSSKEKNN